MKDVDGVVSAVADGTVTPADEVTVNVVDAVDSGESEGNC